MITLTFKVGLNGSIDSSKKFASGDDAISYAKRLWDEFSGDADAGGCDVVVYGYRDFSEDDKTPANERVYLWQHWAKDSAGNVNSGTDSSGNLRTRHKS